LDIFPNDYKCPVLRCTRYSSIWWGTFFRKTRNESDSFSYFVYLYNDKFHFHFNITIKNNGQ